MAADVMDGGLERSGWSIVGFWFAGICWFRGRAILVLFKEVQSSPNMVRLFRKPGLQAFLRSEDLERREVEQLQKP
jgi:hypothetical protein